MEQPLPVRSRHVNRLTGNRHCASRVLSYRGIQLSSEADGGALVGVNLDDLGCARDMSARSIVQRTIGKEQSVLDDLCAVCRCVDGPGKQYDRAGERTGCRHILEDHTPVRWWRVAELARYRRRGKGA